MLTTTHGTLDEQTLSRTVGFEDRPSEFVVWVEWRLLNHADTACDICQQHPDYPRTDAQGHTLVRRDAHCILKEPSEIAEVLVSATA